MPRSCNCCTKNKKLIKAIFKYLLIFLVSLLLFNQSVWVTKSTIEVESLEMDELRNNIDPFVCILSTSKRKYKVGDKPVLNVEIINKSDSAVLMVGSLDGSDIGIRLPICKYTVKHQILGDISTTGFQCGNVNPIREFDFKEVPAEARFDPYERVDDYSYFSSRSTFWDQFLIPGIYKLKFRYSTMDKDNIFWTRKKMQDVDSTMIKWYFAEGKEDVYYRELRKKKTLDSLWNLVPDLELESNTLTIEYKLKF